MSRLNWGKCRRYGALGALLLVCACARDFGDFGPPRETAQERRSRIEGEVIMWEKARQREPNNLIALEKMGLAYEKKRDWVKMAGVFAELCVRRPTFANHRFKLGYAQLQLALHGVPDQEEAALKSLQTCVDQDPNFSECYHWLAELHEYQDHPQAALANYTRAIATEPARAESFAALAQLYFATRFFDQATAVIEEGVRLIPKSQATHGSVRKLLTVAARMAQSRDNRLPDALRLATTGGHGGIYLPEYHYELGMACLAARPPQLERARRLLRSFIMRACEPRRRKQHKGDCEAACTELVRLAEQAPKSPTGPKVPRSCRTEEQ